MRLEQLNKAQTFELFDQMKKHLLMYADKTVKFVDCYTAHKLVSKYKHPVYVECWWIYFQKDVFITELKAITKEEYEEAQKLMSLR